MRAARIVPVLACVTVAACSGPSGQSAVSPTGRSQGATSSTAPVIELRVSDAEQSAPAVAVQPIAPAASSPNATLAFSPLKPQSLAQALDAALRTGSSQSGPAAGPQWLNASGRPLTIISAPSVSKSDAAVGAPVSGAPPVSASVSGNSVTISWHASSLGDPPTSWVVDYWTPSGQHGGPLQMTDSIIQAGNLGAGTYSVQVCGKVGSVVGGCTTVSFTIAALIPDPPRGLQSSLDADNHLTLAWQGAPGGAPPLAFVVVANGQEYNRGISYGLATGDPIPPGHYVIYVIARNAAGDSAPSNVLSFDVVCSAPPAPAMAAPSVNGKTATLSWSPVSGSHISYRLAIAGSSGQVIDVAGTSYSAQFSPGTYSAAVAAKNGCGTWSDPSASVSFTIADTQYSFTGSYSASGSITRVFTDTTCTWPITYSGSATLTASLKDDGTVSGTLNVNGSWNAPAGTSTASGFNCAAGSGTYNSTQAAGGPPGAIASGAAMDIATGTFSGSALSANLVIGTLSAAYTRGTGTVVIPVTLRR